MKTIEIDNIRCLVGGNASENWQILENAKSEHLFFHLSSFSSCYVIGEIDSVPNLEAIKKMAECCKSNTKYKNIPKVKVDYTLCGNVYKGENVGEVYYKSNKKVNKIVV